MKKDVVKEVKKNVDKQDKSINNIAKSFSEPLAQLVVFVR